MFASSAAFCKGHTSKPSQKAYERLHIALGMFWGCTAAAWSLFLVLIDHMSVQCIRTKAVHSCSFKKSLAISCFPNFGLEADNCMLERHMSCAHLWELAELARANVVCGKALMLQQN